MIPSGAENFAVIGQFCEIPRDCVFTVEYSVRSAWTAVHGLTGQVAAATARRAQRPRPARVIARSTGASEC